MKYQNTIKEFLHEKLNQKHGREIEIISMKYLGIRGYAVKFQFLDDEYIKSEIVKL